MLYQVTESRLFSEDMNFAMLTELATRHLGMSQEAVDKLAKQKLSKASGTVATLTYGKLRTVIRTKMDNGWSKEHPSWTEDGAVELDFACLEPKAEERKERTKQGEDSAAAGEDTGPAFGANTRKRGAAGGAKAAPKHTGAVPRTGKYKVAKRPASGSVNGDDAGKWEIWQHVWNCTSFEEYFAKAPAKGATSATNRIITASMEMNWALKSGWIVPEAAEAERKDEENSASSNE